ncbi:MAG: hypothetical protein KKG99_05270 [Bacteroidetes bacterium]|nr:hypothetical protein [Bacteroidota bacterium]
MKRILFITLLVGFHCLSNAQESSKNLDFSAIYQHFIVMEQLQSGKEPIASQWADLFETPAYKTLLDNELRKPIRFQEVFRAAYLPGYSKDINDILVKIDRKGSWWTSWVTSLLEAYENVPKQKTQLLDLVDAYKRLDLSEFAMKEAARFLPDEKFEGFPKVAFLIFNDSRGYDPIILSLNSFLKTDDIRDNNALDCMINKGFNKHFSFQLLYAHEAFHYYRNKKDEFRFPDDTDPYSSLIWIMNQIANEGIADQIDKVNQYFDPGCYADTREGEQYLNYLAMQPDLIRSMDSLFVEIINLSDSAQIFSRRFSRMIPRSGHQTGFYMCNAIIEEFGEQSIRMVSRNPFTFFKLYQKAALKNEKYPVFSKDAIACIEMLEEKFSLE